MIRRFQSGDDVRGFGDRLNQMVDACNAFLSMNGGGLVEVQHTPAGCVISVSADTVGGAGPSPNSVAVGFDAWVRVTQTGTVTISSEDWRGYMLPVWVIFYDGTEANARNGSWAGPALFAGAFAQAGGLGDTASTNGTLWYDSAGLRAGLSVSVDEATDGTITLTASGTVSSEFQARVMVGNIPPTIKSGADFTI